MKLPAAAIDLLRRVRQLRQRFDERIQRERMLMIVAAGAVLLWASDTLWLSPAQHRLTSALKQAREAESAQKALQEDLQRLSLHGQSQTIALRKELATWRQRARDGEESLRRFEDKLVGPDQVVGLIDSLLARHGQLRVRSLRTLPRVDLLAPTPAAAAAPKASSTDSLGSLAVSAVKEAAAAVANATATTSEPSAAAAVARANAISRNSGSPASAAASAAASAPAHPATDGKAEGSLYRHGVELVLVGSYPDLLAYLRAVESQPKRVLWGGMALKVEQYPYSAMTLRLYTVSRDRHWLEL